MDIDFDFVRQTPTQVYRLPYSLRGARAAFEDVPLVRHGLCQPRGRDSLQHLLVRTAFSCISLDSVADSDVVAVEPSSSSVGTGPLDSLAIRLGLDTLTCEYFLLELALFIILIVTRSVGCTCCSNCTLPVSQRG